MSFPRPRIALLLLLWGFMVCNAGRVLAVPTDEELTYQGKTNSHVEEDDFLFFHGRDNDETTAPTVADELDAIRQHMVYQHKIAAVFLGLFLFYFCRQAFMLRLHR